MKWSELLKRLPTAQLTNSPSFLAADPELMGVASIEAAPADRLTFLDQNSPFAAQLNTTAAAAVILPLSEPLQELATQRGIAWVASAQPRLLFAEAMAQFYQPFRPAVGIHPTAVIDPSVQLGREVSLGAHVVVQAGAVLGDQVCIHPNVVIYPGVQVGDRSVLHANCVIHERTQIGPDCVIHSGAVIGSEGFGFVPTREGWFKMEQSGITVLEDGVEVGCNSCIDRPAVGETRIGRNTKIDNLVHIGHGCTVGEACAMAGQVGLAGGVQVGNRVILAGQVGVANRAKIGDGAIVSSQSGVHGEINPGEVVSGSPAIPNRLWLKATALYSRLPELHKSLKQVQKRLEEMGREIR
jgi:UDP-3-O-[3-hydroxymyristoyl] glucosamine N-acyltransferase